MNSRSTSWLLSLILLFASCATPATALRTPVKTDELRAQVKTDSRLPVPKASAFQVETKELIANYRFRGVETAAQRFEVSIGLRAVEIVLPQSEGDAFVYRMAEALSTLPAAMLEFVSRVEAIPIPSPDDKMWAERYHRPILAGMTGGADGTLRVFQHGLAESHDVFVRNLLHECGHLWSQRVDGPLKDHGAGWNIWRNAIRNDRQVPSQYASASIEEDVAEATALYLTTLGTSLHDEYKKLFPSRFMIIDETLKPSAKEHY